MLLTILSAIKVLLLIALFAVFGILGFIMASFRNKVPFVPSPRKVVRKMVDLADARPGEKICDLGSGTGRILFEAARQYPQNMIYGIENSLTLRIVSGFLLVLHPLARKRIKIVNRDFFNVDLHNLDVIFCFLTPEALRILAPKFQALKTGSRIIAYMFPLENQENFTEAIEHVGDKDTIYYYKKIA